MITTPDDLKARFTGDPYSLPDSPIIETLLQDAEDILQDEINDIFERAEENEAIERKVKRVVSNSVIRYINTAAEGISAHQMSMSGVSEMITYSQAKNKNLIFFTEEELKGLRGKEAKDRVGFIDVYSGGAFGNPIIDYRGKTAIYAWDRTDVNKNDYFA